MSDLKKQFALLLLFILVIFALPQIKVGQQSFIYFPSHFYFLVVLAVISSMSVPLLRFMSFGTLMLFWGTVFVVIAWLYLLYQGVSYLQVTLIEAVFLSIAIWIAYQMNVQISASEGLMALLASSTYPNNTVEMNNATRQIDVEMNRSRRHQRPLSLLYLRPEKVRADEDQKAYRVLREDLLKQFVYARIGQIIANQTRETDLIMRDREGNFIILCAETERERSTLLAQRVRATIAESMGADLSWGVAAFPQEALTFEELLQKAQQETAASQITAQTPVTQGGSQ